MVRPAPFHPATPEGMDAYADAPPDVPGDGGRARQCGRCRLYFDGDPDQPPDVMSEWWLCAPCREVLLGHGPAHSTAGASGSA
jgi:hypothetical protein